MAGIWGVSRKEDGQREQSLVVCECTPMRSHTHTYAPIWFQTMSSQVWIHVSTMLAKIQNGSLLLNFRTTSTLLNQIPPPNLTPDNHSPVPHFYNVISRMLYTWNHTLCNLLGLTFSIWNNSLESRA